MKIKFEKKYLEIGIISFLVIAASLMFYYFLFHYTTFLGALSKVFKIISPVIYGFILAFLMTPVFNYIEKKIVKVIFVKMKADIIICIKFIKNILSKKIRHTCSNR